MSAILSPLALLLVAIAAVPFARMRAQGSAHPSAVAVEVESRARWMNARQMAIHTPHVRTTTWIHVDSVVSDSSSATRMVWGRLGDRANFGEAMKLVVARDGHLRDVSVQRRQSPALAMMRTARDSARSFRFGLLDLRSTYLILPASRAWDLVPVFRPARAAAGARWSDTIDFSSAIADMRHSISGVRTYTIQRDTTIAGKQYWIVRDSATVTWTEQFPVDERLLEAPATMNREVRGPIVGRSVVDPSTGLLHTRTDSADLRGDASLAYPDGRLLRTATRYNRAQRWTSYDASALARRESQLTAEREANSFSIVRVPRNPMEERLAAGDKRTVDSLYHSWFSSRDPDHRAEIKTLLRSWQLGDSSSRARLQAAYAAEGDTVFLLENMLFDRRITLQYARLALQFMRDPQLAFAHGVSRDIPYERPVEVLAWDPPAIQSDSSKWMCDASACRLIADEWRTATEPRLRSVALAVLTLMNPLQWRDTFLVRARTGDKILQLARPMVEGNNAAGFPVRPGVPMPGPDATWMAWRDWVRGPAASAPPVSGRGSRPPPPPQWLVSGGNIKHVEFAQAATGRDIAGELLRLYRSAPGDTALVVVANVLAGLRALPFGEDSIAVFAMHANPLFRALATRLITGSFAGTVLTFSRADSATGAVIHRQLMGGLSSKREPWATIEERTTGGGGAGPFREPPTDAPGAQHPVHYDLEQIDASVRAELAGSLQSLTRAEWDARSLREGGELWSISAVERSERFARVTVSVAGRIQRAATQGPQAWYSSTTYYLMQVNGEWLLVSKTSVVT